MPRGLREPLAPVFPAVGFGLCVWMVSGLDAVTWTVFGIWLVAGLVVYFGYGVRRSRPADTAETK